DSHYAHLSDDGKRRIGATIRATNAATVADAIRAYGDVGADEVLLVPMVPALEQVHRAIELWPEIRALAIPEQGKADPVGILEVQDRTGRDRDDTRVRD